MLMHKYRYITITILIMMVAVIVIMILVFISNKEANHKNGFTRRFAGKTIRIIHELAIHKSIRSFCGRDGEYLYMDTYKAGEIYRVDSNLTNIQFINLRLPDNDTVNSLFTTFVDKTSVYIMAGNVPSVTTTSIGGDSTHTYRLRDIFTRGLMFGKNDFFCRAYKKNSGKWKQVLLKIKTKTITISAEKLLPGEQQDAGISTDGLLHADERYHRLLYISYYSNSFFCLDTNLALLYKSRTIDTASNPSVETNYMDAKKSGSITNITPIRDVNLQSCIDDGNLFVNSALEADNESHIDFIRNSVIDVYDTKSGIYKTSFYVPLYKGQRLKEFTVKGEYIVVLYQGYLVVFAMSAIS